jgi:hypothetical protein
MLIARDPHVAFAALVQLKELLVKIGQSLSSNTPASVAAAQ